ncbi:MAG: hypothetical protein NTW07_04425 [candidate division Zixibacteria bacterium]|nr:hypothetical protein [candidate division Zixibacteria bacterium]
MNFIFWVRAQDPDDSTVVDPTPAYCFPQVVDPHHERDVLVVDWSIAANRNQSLIDSARSYWRRAVQTWVQDRGLEDVVEFDTLRDVMISRGGFEALPSVTMAYKIVIVYQDAMQSGFWNSWDWAVSNLMLSLLAGNSAWITARVPIGNYSALASKADTAAATASYKYFFGIDSYMFPGWGYYIYSTQDGVGPEWGYGLPRTEDFVGAFSLNEELWPELTVDSARLHECYEWRGTAIPPTGQFMPWRPDLAALPQVGYVVPTGDAQVMYTYKSMYGPVHPILQQPTYDGLPVMVRLDRGIFRTVHSNFTPISLEETSGQQMVDSVLSWLYEKWLPGAAEPPPSQIDCDLIRNLTGRKEQ